MRFVLKFIRGSLGESTIYINCHTGNREKVTIILHTRVWYQTAIYIFCHIRLWDDESSEWSYTGKTMHLHQSTGYTNLLTAPTPILSKRNARCVPRAPLQVNVITHKQETCENNLSNTCNTWQILQSSKRTWISTYLGPGPDCWRI